MQFFEKNFITVRNFLFNGIYAYALFGVYALTVAPLVTHLFNYREPNMFIAIFGFIMYVSEFFALNFKMKMIRIRAEEKSIQYKNQMGRTIIPSVSQFIFFAFFMRLVFRTAVIMVIMTALGYECSETSMSIQGEIAVMLGILLDLIGFGYIYVKSDMYTDPAQSKKEWNDDIKENEDWYKANIEKASSLTYWRYELISDIILQVYALMLYTAFWQYINQKGIQLFHEGFSGNAPGNGMSILVCMFLFITVMFGLVPMRIAYWVEDSITAFEKKEKRIMWLIFALSAIYTCSPFLVEFFSVSLFGFSKNQASTHMYIQYIISASFFILLLLIQVYGIGKETDSKKTDEQENT